MMMMGFLVLLPFFVQILVINIDEFYFHIKRGLPKWERLGHPLDTLTVLACFAFILFFPYSSLNLKIYIALALFSCIFVTKDEFVHKECCPAAEQWLHALLFINHPIVLTAAALVWASPAWLGLSAHEALLRKMMWIQTIAIATFFCYQTIYWNFLWKDKAIE